MQIILHVFSYNGVLRRKANALWDLIDFSEEENKYVQFRDGKDHRGSPIAKFEWAPWTVKESKDGVEIESVVTADDGIPPREFELSKGQLDAMVAIFEAEEKDEELLPKDATCNDVRRWAGDLFTQVKTALKDYE